MVNRNGLQTPSWDLGFKSGFREENISDVAALIETIGDPSNLGTKEDTRSWTPGKNGEFSVSSCYEMIDGQQQLRGQAQARQRRMPSNYIWNSAIPTKVSFLV
ncbi:hypothetical protein C5167_045144 [Papaver somniferum]|uniref:Uncharacterized protein n=1 Tax=Papaver somniferum TaxID=3469 RepID=A0A4Y7LBG9_PAPSO|nr:hypothetical protein C5167_045144 [Papaver somniferum]